MTERDRQIGFALFAIGALLLLANLGGTDTAWVWLAAIGAAFLVSHKRTAKPGTAVPGSILLGLAAGLFLDTIFKFGGNSILLGLAAGFYFLPKIEKTYTWAIWPAIILAGVAGLNFISNQPWLSAIILLAGGAFFLWSGNNSTSTGPTALPTNSSNQAATGSNLFDQLTLWRKNQSHTETTTPQQILSDIELDAIAYAKPKNMKNLGDYLDKIKLERYGVAILKIIGKE